ncbi:DUF3102 domain-containing protein [Levilactobacillus brevis]|uniref:DUF3102 domain-containing protein n=1 Tax=Levilactobacillus brevis TaxID=1580 RepID=A0AA41ERX9_LEVBR|nr:DUF3102 domain-containing protein [Levilactobacillus brevis]MBS0948621.1 DUF3102 domain-containing protein [Levilactobacillus brevis]MBS1011777.1 DUF3102 domain-containing protein [Levilactobacillus brevis]
METTGRRDITATAEETSSVGLSHNLTTVTTEIKAYQSIGGQAIFEIGRRLKWVKENDLAHGEFGKWLKSLDIERTFATRAMKITSELDSNYATGHNLGMKALYEIATMPSDERDKPQELNSGEIKKPDEMTVRELRETKRKLAAACLENQKKQDQLSLADKKAQALKMQVEQLQQRKPDVQQVEVEPADYQDLKQDNQALNTTIRQSEDEIKRYKHLIADSQAELKRLGDLELNKELSTKQIKDLQAKSVNLENKIQRQEEQLERVKELSSFTKQASEEMDKLTVILSRLDITVVPDGAPLILNLTEIADKAESFADNLHAQIANPVPLD